MKLVNRLWNEQDGAIVSAELVLIASILVIGVIVGLKSLRDSVVTELADLGQAIANIDQSYSYSGTAGHHAFTGGGFFSDLPDFCDLGNTLAIQESKCVTICNSLTHPTGAGADGF